MRLLTYFLATILFMANTAAASSYLSFSFGGSYEDHKFDVWNGAGLSGRRALNASARSSDYALAFGIHDTFALAGREFDLELEVFERMNSSFTATGTAGKHPTRLKTTSILLSAWSRVAGRENWSLMAGAGIGARHSSYTMSGPGISFHSTDRAPYVMLGLRLTKKLNPKITLFSEIRAHTRPAVHSKGNGAYFNDPLEHNSKGITVRMGVQINLGR